MKTKLRQLIVLFLLLGYWQLVYSQSQLNNSREKIYLQLDKPLYQQGDIVRFNLIVLDASTHLPTNMSDVVYAELIDPKGSVVKRLSLPVLDGTSKGDFELPDIGGLYTLKAYTAWSSNFDDIYLLKRQIPVQDVITTRLLIRPDFDQETYSANDTVLLELEIRDLKDNPAVEARVDYQLYLAGVGFSNSMILGDKYGKAKISFSLPGDLSTTDVIISVKVTYLGVEESIIRAVPVLLNQVDLNFYPEGGHPVTGHKTVIAFEAIDEFDKGTNIKGVILDNLDNIITRFETFHDGMGAFEMKYEKGVSYRAKIISPVIDQEFELPKASSLPVLGLAKQSEEEIRLDINGATGSYTLEGFFRGKRIYNEQVNRSSEIVILQEPLPTGIIRFVLSDSAQNPLSERLVFANKDRTLNIKIETDQDSYLPGDKVKMKVMTTNEDGNPIPMKFGLSVVDDQLISFSDDRSDHIFSYFHLSSELGPLEEPIFYFDEKEEKADAALNLLMLVRGWSDYKWKDLSSENIQFAPEKIRMVTGILEAKNGDPIKGELYALEVGGDNRMIKITTTENGQFVIRDFNPTTELYLFTKKPNRLVVDDKRARTVATSRDRLPWYQTNEFVIEQFEIEDIDAEVDFDEIEVLNGELSLSMEGASELQEVVVVGYGTELKSGITGSVTTIRSSNIQLFSSMNSLQGVAAGVVVTNKSIDPTIPPKIVFSQAKSLVSGNRSPLVVVNGFTLSPSISRHFINTEKFSPDILQEISFMDSPIARLHYGSIGNNGIIFLETKSRISFDSYSYHKKKGKYQGVVLIPGKFSIVRDVYQLPERKESMMGTRKELGQLVYWNPEVITDDEGFVELTFHLNDQISNFRIVAEGISNNGRIGRKERTFSTFKPLSLDIKLPNLMGYEDKVQGNLVVTNETNKNIDGYLAIDCEGLEFEYQPKLNIPPNSRFNVPVVITSKNKAGTYQIGIAIDAGKYSDSLEEQLEVFPVGFPTALNHSGANPNVSFKFDISEVESGSLFTELRIYPNVVSDLESSAASLFQEPHGCFEQVSSTTYPSILALRYLNSTGSGSPNTKKKHLNLLSLAIRS